MHDLERLVENWRVAMAKDRICGRETIEELESHLRENVDELVRNGMSEVEAFQRAVTQLGSPHEIAAEFRKTGGSVWLPIKLATGTTVVGALWAAVLVAHSTKLASDFLLGSHVYLVTLGYLAVYLAGALGVCFVCQRCFSDFSTARAQSIRRALLIFSGAAAVLTTAAVILGAIWAKREWGRYWAWDPKETGALCVVAWMILLLCADRLRWFSPRTILVMSILGNVIVSLAWFGANLISNLHSYGMQGYYWVLTIAVISHLLVFLVGLGPAGWLRLGKV